MKDFCFVIFVKWFDDDVVMLLLECLDLCYIVGNQCWWCQVGEIQYQQFFGVVVYLEWIVDDEGLGMYLVQQMGVGDIVYVEGWILLQLDYVEFCQIDIGLFVKVDMIVLFVL